MAECKNPDFLAMLGMPHDKRPSMKDLTRFLTKFCPLWVEIGLKLGLRQTLLDVIKLDNPLKHRDCFRITLQKWLEQNTRADWKTLELAITNATRESKDLNALTMEQMLQKLAAPDVDEVIPIQELRLVANEVMPIQEEKYFEMQANDIQGYGRIPEQRQQQRYNSMPEQRYGNIPDQRHGDIPDQRHGNIPDQRHGDIPDQRHGNIPDQRYGGIPDQRHGNIPDQRYQVQRYDSMPEQRFGGIPDQRYGPDQRYRVQRYDSMPEHGVQEQRFGGAEEQINGGVQDHRNGEAAVINPEIAPTVNCGKGMVKDAVFAEAKKAICCIKSPVMTGTGFLGYARCGEEIYCTVLVTNNHVIKTFGDAMGSRIIFENVFPDRNITLKGSEICVRNSFWCSPLNELDYTLVEIDEDKLVDSKTNRSLDISPMQLIRPADIKEGDQIYVIQHPRGEQLAFSSSDSIVLDPLLLYQCTTDLGSSGSPVLKEVDGELKVVALHRGGREANVNWLGYNCGTLMCEILNHLNGRPVPLLPTNNTVQETLRRHQK